MYVLSIRIVIVHSGNISAQFSNLIGQKLTVDCVTVDAENRAWWTSNQNIKDVII